MIHAAYVLGVIIFYAALIMRGQRSEDLRLELQDLRDERAENFFWDMRTDEQDKAIADKTTDYNSWSNKLKFEAKFFGLILASAFSCGVAGLLWIINNPNPPDWKEVSDPIFLWFIVVPLVSFAYAKSLAKIDEIDHQLRWLRQMLKVVKDRSEDMRKASINEYLELKTRIDYLERR
jgi:hypothetical protein